MDDVWLLTAAARVLHRAGLRAEAQLQAVEGVLAAVITWPASRLVRGARRVLYAALHRTLGTLRTPPPLPLSPPLPLNPHRDVQRPSAPALRRRA